MLHRGVWSLARYSSTIHLEHPIKSPKKRLVAVPCPAPCISVMTVDVLELENESVWRCVSSRDL